MLAALFVGALSGASPFVQPTTAHGAAAASFPPPNGHDGQWHQGPPPPQQQQQQSPAPSLDPREQQPRRKKGQPERRYTLDQWRTGLYAVAAAAARGAPGVVSARAAGTGEEGARRRVVGARVTRPPICHPLSPHPHPHPCCRQARSSRRPRRASAVASRAACRPWAITSRRARPQLPTRPVAPITHLHPAHRCICRVAGAARNRRREPARGDVAGAARAHCGPISSVQGQQQVARAPPLPPGRPRPLRRLHREVWWDGLWAGRPRGGRDDDRQPPEGGSTSSGPNF